MPGYLRPRGHPHADDLRGDLGGVNVSLALTLFPRMGAAGIATAAAVAGWVNAPLLFGMLVWRGHWGRDIAAPDAHSTARSRRRGNGRRAVFRD